MNDKRQGQTAADSRSLQSPQSWNWASASSCLWLSVTSRPGKRLSRWLPYSVLRIAN